MGRRKYRIETDEKTVTIFRQEEYEEYSDAMGEITISKRDNKNASLDGAIFDILVEFANGETAGNSSFEVYNGTRTFNYTHPRNDAEPAKVTVREVRSPDGYSYDPTPQFATVHPSYVRTTRVVTRQITVVTTTTSVVEIESGNVVATSEASAETELTPPSEAAPYIDAIEGDRDINLTFVNTPEPASLTLIKTEKGRDSVFLPGARFRIIVYDGDTVIYEDIQTTDANGRITWTFPQGGRAEIEELNPPVGYQMGTETFWTVHVPNGGHETLSVTNDKNSELLVYKRDSIDGTFLSGAVFVAELLRSHTEPIITGQRYTAVSDSNGLARFDNLIPGEYRVWEEEAPPYYHKSTEVFTVSVYDGSVTTESLTFYDDRFSGLTIIKVDSITGARLQGAIFSLYEGTEVYPTAFLGDYQTNERGEIIITNLPTFKEYTIVEKQAPYGYEVDQTYSTWTIYLKPEDLEQSLQLIFRNPPKPKLLIIKESEDGTRLPNAVFRLERQGSSMAPIDVQTGSDGTVLIENLEAGVPYRLVEIRSPEGFVHEPDKEEIFILDVGEVKEIVWINKSLPKVSLFKYDQYSGEGIEGISFKFTRQDDGTVQYGTTGPGGILDLIFEPGWIIVEEINAPGYVLDGEARTYLVEAGKDLLIEWPNIPRPTVTIRKLCSLTGQPLVAGFEVKVKDGRILGTFWTDEETGEFTLEDELLGFEDFPLYLEITETVPPSGYLITEEKIEITLQAGQNYTYVWENTPENPILIYKRDLEGQPIKGAEFEVRTVEGTLIGHFKSGTNGYAVVGGIQPGHYLVRETKVSSDEFILDEESELVELRVGKPAYVEFINNRKPYIEILKLSAGDNPTPLQGVLMRVERLTGELIGDFRTDHEGKITLQVDPGFVRVFELESIPGFTLDSTPVIKELSPNSVTPFVFYNQSVPGYMLQKIDSVSKIPLAGVKYSITRLDGGIIGTGVYETDEQGIIYLDLDEPYIVVTEIATIEGYRLSSTPRTIRLTPNELYIDRWENTPYPKFELIKENENGEPLASVKFKLFDSYMREVGIYQTNSLGRIMLTGMSAGKYYIQEYQTSGPEYRLDRTVYEISLSYGQTTTLRLVNEKTGNVKIRKVSDEDGKPLSGATYLIYDDKNNVLFEKTTDVYGWITLENMEPQRIYLREIKAPKEFVLDDALYGPYEIPSGGTLEITLKNKPERGRIRIQKVSSGYNEITKDKADAGLKSAKFEIYNNQMELVDTIVTDSNGYATSIDLPLGVYMLKEKKSPDYYFSDSDAKFYAEIKVHDDTVSFIVKNKPVELEVTAEKRGVNEALAGESIVYNLSNIENKSNVPLEEFYLHDVLPNEAVRLETVWTGVWSEREKFDFQIRTNRKSGWGTVQSNLLSTTNNEIDCSPSALGLASGEYVTEFRMIFKGEVQPGFKCTTGPAIQVKVLDTIQSGQKFTNKLDVGGRYLKEWVYITDGWTVTSFNKPRGDLPKTGWDVALSGKKSHPGTYIPHEPPRAISQTRPCAIT